MPVTAQRRETPSPSPVAPTQAAARKLAENLMDAMSALLAVIERETEPRKAELSRNYVNAVGQLKANQKQLAQAAPELLKTLHRHHDVFRSMLQINLTVLATAHAVSENIVRGVNAEMQRRSMPNTYTAAGKRAAPSPRHITPLSVSRSL
jgi:hypothetical protein